MSLDASFFPGPSPRLDLIVLTHLSAMRLLINDYIFHGVIVNHTSTRTLKHFITIFRLEFVRMKPFLVPASLNPKPTVVSLSKRNTSLIFPENGIRNQDFNLGQL